MQLYPDQGHSFASLKMVTVKLREGSDSVVCGMDFGVGPIYQRRDSSLRFFICRTGKLNFPGLLAGLVGDVSRGAWDVMSSWCKTTVISPCLDKMHQAGQLTVMNTGSRRHPALFIVPLRFLLQNQPAPKLK